MITDSESNSLRSLSGNESIFLCYSRRDLESVREVSKLLRNESFNIWFDEDNLIAGQDWKKEIRAAISNANKILVFISNHSIGRKGYFNVELQIALEESMLHPEEKSFILPVRLDECALPEVINRWYAIDLFKEDGWSKLIASIKHNLEPIDSNISLNSCDTVSSRENPQSLYTEVNSNHHNLNELIRACKLQIKNEIEGAIGQKYIPKLHVDRSSKAKIISFIEKDNHDIKINIDNATSHIATTTYDLHEKVLEIEKTLSKNNKNIKSKKLARYREKLQENKALLDGYKDLESYFLLLKNSAEYNKSDIYKLMVHIDESPHNKGEIRSNYINIKNHFKSCLLIKDVAGRGKTNTSCALALEYVKIQPVILIAAGMLKITDKFSLETYIEKALSIFCNEKKSLSDIIKIAKGSNKNVLVIIDAINENSDTKLLKSSLQYLFSSYSKLGVSFIVTCRDIYWSGFIKVKDDFWDEYIYKKISLGHFTIEEFKNVLPLYFEYFGIKAELSDDSTKKLREPLLLRFFCEAYKGDGKISSLGLISDIRLKPLFDEFWHNKISSVKTTLDHRSSRSIEEFILLLARKIRFIRNRNLSLKDISRITGINDFESSNSIYTRLLDERIILEKTPSKSEMWNEPYTTFVYDEFMEYVLATEIIRNIMSRISDDNLFIIKLNRILCSALKFKPIFGVVAYLLPMMEEQLSYDGWMIVYLRGKIWFPVLSKALCRVSPQRISESAKLIAYKLAKRGDNSIKIEMLNLANESRRTQPDFSVQIYCCLINVQLSSIYKPAFIGLKVLSSEGNLKATKSLIGCLKYKNHQTKCRAIYSLLEVNNLPINMALKLASDDSEYVREAAIYSLGRIYTSDKKDILKDVFIKALRDPFSFVRNTALDSLHMIENNLPPILAEDKK